MENVTTEGQNAVLRLSREEVRFLHQSLNEILNGVGFTDDELSTRLGAKRNELESLMQDLGLVLDEMK